MAEALRVIRGAPTDEELAALVGVLLGRTAAPVSATAPPVSRWAGSARPHLGGRLRRPGPDSWRASGLPG
jgi:hypothetical protein